ncbi:hypothetical protein GBAR_LOCUS4247 [Geodia barretti]|uniref:Uncharacterized protein n=1 Tax=Geodia barretti TaxID=519541 RepID=A0AA35R618_GEOBA|nr:hypothetical protein GBAR_LOCUS4247 [Geodia barretti]
MSCGPVRT